MGLRYGTKSLNHGGHREHGRKAKYQALVLGLQERRNRGFPELAAMSPPPLVLSKSSHFPATMVRVKATIYVVEDDPDISRLVRHHLDRKSTRLNSSHLGI